MSQRVLLSLSSVLLLALAACPVAEGSDAPEPDDDESASDNDACRCIEGRCIAPDEIARLPPSAPSSQPNGVERLSDPGTCQPTASDAQARTTGYTCNGTERVVVSYDGDSVRLATVTATTGDTVDRRVFTWTGDRLLGEVRTFSSDGATQQQRSFTLSYDGDAVVGLAEEIVGPADLVLVRAVTSWDTAGRVQRSVERNGDDVLTNEVEFRWQGDVFVGATTTHHDIDPSSAPGCTEVTPRVMVCETTVTYDADGAPTAMTVDGETVPVSEQCCSRNPCPG